MTLPPPPPPIPQIRKPPRNLVKCPPDWELRHTVSHVGAYSIERISTEHDLHLEAHCMGHDLNRHIIEAWEASHRLYSVRDDLGVPHATIVCGIVGDLKMKSPYNDCAPLGTRKACMVAGKPLRVLCVWGRGGKLARVEYLRLVRDWYVGHHGQAVSEVNWWLVEKESKWRGDQDTKYHFEYLLEA